MVNKFIKSIEIKKHVILNSFQDLFKKTGLPRSHSFARNDVLLCKKPAITLAETPHPYPSPRGEGEFVGECANRTNSGEVKRKPAITLAEIIIVIFIVGIIAGVFMAMPKKNVGKTDRAKYYVAYDMLKRLQDEQMADSGTVGLSNLDFCNAINTWLNITSPLNCNNNPNTAQLTNGMVIYLRESVQNNAEGEPEQKTVKIDIDGASEGNCTNNQDCHEFFLTNDGRVVPQGNGANSTDWIAFKVYNFDDNGKAQFRVTNVSYNQAQDCFNNVGDVCSQCAGNSCFMEAIQPLGK